MSVFFIAPPDISGGIVGITAMSLYGPLYRTAAATALLASVTSYAAPVAQAPDLDLSIMYYSRVVTAEGVTRESSYEEKMLRRPGHVWVARVLPQSLAQVDEHHSDHEQRGMKKALADGGSKPEGAHKHKHFNYVLLPRHVARDGEKMKLEFIDFREREVVNIMPSEYENVNFDGSWNNAFFLVDPQNIGALPLSPKASPVVGARWRERENNGMFQRVLWDDQKMIPLLVESGDRAGNFYQRIAVKPQAVLAKDLPWLKVKGFAQKEYADFLD